MPPHVQKAISIRLWAAFLAALIAFGCGERSEQGNDPGSAAGAATISESKPPVFSQAPPAHYLDSFADLAGAGLDGLAIHYALDLYGALHGPPQGQLSTNSLIDLIPFRRPLEEFTLQEALGPDGTTKVLLAERALTSTSPESARWRSLQLSGECPSLTGFTPKVGIDAGMERYFTGAPVPAPAHWSQQGWTQQVLAGFAAQLAQDDPDQTPAGTAVTARLGYLAMILRKAAEEAARLNTATQRAPASLNDLAALYGGLNSAAWVNPYTGKPMANVPASKPSAGDYSDLSSGEGTWIAIYYLDAQGNVRPSYAGYRQVWQAHPLGM